MSDLQIGLLMLGVLVVAGVLAFNWHQERQFRRRAEQAFAGGHDDILFERPAAMAATAALRPTAAEDVRIEPHMNTPADSGPPGTKSFLPQPEIDYIVEI